MKKELLIIFLLLLLTIPAVKSLLIPGGFTSHDLTHHVVRQISMHKILSEGQFPPRWSADLAYGYGYPVFLFNYPLPALIGEVFHLMGFGFLDSVKAVLFLSLILSTVGMYLFLKSLFNSTLGAFLGAIFYLYAPIHLIVVYVSGSAGASFGLVFPPFIFWSIVKLWQGETNKFILAGSLSVAGLILSHNVTAFIFTPLILGFVIVLKLLSDKKEHNHFLRNVVFMFLLGLGLSAFFWLSAMGEKQFIRYDQLMKGVYIDQFPSLKQVIYSPWGYGLSHPKMPEGGMSYQIGLAHILIMIIQTIALWFFWKRKTFLLLGIFTLLSFIFSIVFMLEVSLPLWQNLPFLSYIQFPLRLLIVSVFSACLAAALLVKYLPLRGIFFTFLLILVLYANRNHLGINQKFDPGEGYYLSLRGSSTSFDENLPIWVTIMKTDVNHGKFTYLSGQGNVKILEDKSSRVLAEIESTSSARIRFNQYYFPGWEIKVDKKAIKFDYQVDRENHGLPIFDIEKGKHQILAELKNSPVRNIADWISIFSLGIFLATLAKMLYARRY